MDALEGVGQGGGHRRGGVGRGGGHRFRRRRGGGSRVRAGTAGIQLGLERRFEAWDARGCGAVPASHVAVGLQSLKELLIGSVDDDLRMVEIRESIAVLAAENKDSGRAERIQMIYSRVFDPLWKQSLELNRE